MSKMDGLRAMREARYEAARTTPSAAKTRAAVRPTAQPAQARPVADDPEPSGLCGHRAIGGRTCTREHGHAAKSHRYS